MLWNVVVIHFNLHLEECLEEVQRRQDFLTSSGQTLSSSWLPEDQSGKYFLYNITQQVFLQYLFITHKRTIFVSNVIWNGKYHLISVSVLRPLGFLFVTSFGHFTKFSVTKMAFELQMSINLSLFQQISLIS